MIENMKQFCNWEKSSRDIIDFKKIYCDIAGDVRAGLVLSELVYWYLPSKNGGSKLRVEHDGHYWIAVRRYEWWDRTRMSPREADTDIKKLKAKKLIVTSRFKFAGKTTMHIRIVEDVFLKRFNHFMSNPPLNPYLPEIKTNLQNGELVSDQLTDLLIPYTETTSTETTILSDEKKQSKNHLSNHGDGDSQQHSTSCQNLHPECGEHCYCDRVDAKRVSNHYGSYDCVDCGNWANNPHWESHSDDNYLTVICNDCFTSLDKYKRTVKPENAQMCARCQDVYNNEDLLAYDGNLYCETCYMDITSKQSVKPKMFYRNINGELHSEWLDTTIQSTPIHVRCPVCDKWIGHGDNYLHTDDGITHVDCLDNDGITVDLSLQKSVEPGLSITYQPGLNSKSVKNGWHTCNCGCGKFVQVDCQPEPPDYHCIMCGKTGVKLEYIEKHYRSETGIYDMACPDCLEYLEQLSPQPDCRCSICHRWFYETDMTALGMGIDEWACPECWEWVQANERQPETADLKAIIAPDILALDAAIYKTMPDNSNWLRESVYDRMLADAYVQGKVSPTDKSFHSQPNLPALEQLRTSGYMYVTPKLRHYKLTDKGKELCDNATGELARLIAEKQDRKQRQDALKAERRDKPKVKKNKNDELDWQMVQQRYPERIKHIEKLCSLPLWFANLAYDEIRSTSWKLIVKVAGEFYRYPLPIIDDVYHEVKDYDGVSICAMIEKGRIEKAVNRRKAQEKRRDSVSSSSQPIDPMEGVITYDSD